MTISDVPLLSAVPKRSLGEANFSTVADTWAASLVTFNTGMNVTIGEINSTAAAMNSIAAGTAQSMPFTFSTTTTDSDPGAGIIRLNNATQASATALRLDDLDSAGVDIQAIIDTWDDSTSTLAGQIRLIKASDQTKWLQFTITAVSSQAGYTNLTVSNVDSSGVNPFADTDPLLVSFTRTGDKGDTGAPGGVVQVVTTETGVYASGTTIMPFDNTIPQITEGDQYMTRTITPNAVSNILIIEVTALISTSQNTRFMGVALFEGATANALAAVGIRSATNQEIVPVSFAHKVITVSTSELTYRVRVGTDIAATTDFNGSGGSQKYGGVAASSINITEFTP